MPAPAPFPSPYPALYLYPLNDSFIPKHISLLHNTHVKIGRQTNAKTTPGERNGFFDSKVLSRQHAEVWEEGNKIFIKDVKSSNGTFINGERLSPEGLESEPYELKSDDIVEFGIDIVGEDNKTIVHHKVAARVVCIFSEQDAQMAARAEQHQMQQFAGPSSSLSPASNGSMLNQTGSSSGPGSSNSASFNFSGQQPPRRPQLSQQGISGMGGMGGSMRPPGKSGLTFDHILNRLQGELQKSRETGAELHTLTGAMNEIHDTLGGGNLPTSAPPFPHALPPVRLPQPAASPPSQSDAPIVPLPHIDQDSSSSEPLATSTTTTHLQSSSSSSPGLLTELQTQLKDTQTSLSQHVDKIRVLEDALKEQETIRHEVRLLRDMMDALQRREELSQITTSHKTRRQSEFEPRGGFDVDEEEESDSLDDEYEDDSRSVGTAVPHELERVDEEDEESVLTADDESLRGSVDELDLDMAVREEVQPEPPASNEAMDGQFEDVDVEEERHQELGRPRTPEPSHLGMNDLRSKTMNPPPKHSQSLSPTVVDELTTRLTALSAQLESALVLSSTLQAQHSTAQSTISALENKVEALESLVTATLNAQQRRSVIATDPNEHAAPQRAERESLTSMVLEWKKSVEGQWSNVQEEWNQERERLSRAREEWESKVRLVDDGLERIERMQGVAFSKDTPFYHGNGDIKHGLVTPPSPRSLSSDSNRPRRKRSGSRRGRTGSKRRSLSRGADTDDTEATLANDEPHVLDKSVANLVAANRINDLQDKASASPLAASGLSTNQAEDQPLLPGRTSKVYPLDDQNLFDQNHRVNMQTAVGVLVLSVAAAAVVWRIKPDHV
ncbi:hypothetical protein J3R30DRAFT_3522382 [Lentinula aciculospora]|uniref:FHA domain-containing protein n=1 Tax=Lentinula aciculospora TaxID=153920 RepID=A0A9W9A3C5_9AGAR|nr:hypothetical protein J3R30DRAFT_3522382 [Lentinula aciculospora]